MKRILLSIYLCFVMLTLASCASAQPFDEPMGKAEKHNEAITEISPEKENHQIEGEVQEIKVREIYKACKNYFDHTFNTRENSARKAICNGFFYGMGGTLMTLGLSKVDTGICLPANFSTEQFIRDFIAWVKSDITNMDLQAPAGTMRMLSEKYPCF